MHRSLKAFFLGWVIAITAGCDRPLTMGTADICSPETAGETKPSDDGCNTCTCGTDGKWACTGRDCQCTPGDKKVDDDGCNSCFCTEDGQWGCTTMACLDCSPGDKKVADDGCNTCSCTEEGTWACTDTACGAACKPGEKKIDADGCNTCFCTEDGLWGCTIMACLDCSPGSTKVADDGCNTCSCGMDGKWSCTEKACPVCKPGFHIETPVGTTTPSCVADASQDPCEQGRRQYLTNRDNLLNDKYRAVGCSVSSDCVIAEEANACIITCGEVVASSIAQEATSYFYQMASGFCSSCPSPEKPACNATPVPFCDNGFCTKLILL